MKINIKGFFKENNHKWMTLKIWWLTGWYRFLLVALPRKNYEKSWGVIGEETPIKPERDFTIEEKRYVIRVSHAVNRSSGNTPWKSLCLVRALTARHLLLKKNIPCTLYLGVGHGEKGEMVAHAWLRVADFYVSGGNGADYACVAKFANY